MKPGIVFVFCCLLISIILPVCVRPAAAGAGQAAGNSENVRIFNQAGQFFRQAGEIVATDPQQAEKLYRKALIRYRKLIDAGVANGKLYYDIANTYDRLGDIGRAIANYRRAQQFMPDDENLRHNLNYVLNQRQDKIELKEKEKVLKTLFFWHYDLPYPVRAAIFAVFYILFWILLLVRFRKKGGLVHWGLALSLFVSAATMTSLVVERRAEAGHRPGVVVAPEVIARKGDGTSYQPSFNQPLHAGTECTLLAERGNWLQVELANGSSTWLPKDSVSFVY